MLGKKSIKAFCTRTVVKVHFLSFLFTPRPPRQFTLSASSVGEMLFRCGKNTVPLPTW